MPDPILPINPVENPTWVALAHSPLTEDMSSRLMDTDEGTWSYSGSDMRVLLDVPGSGQQSKQLLQMVTLTVSVHREKSPARALGYINPKGYARGRRTIAGTMILTQFNVDFLYQFLPKIAQNDLSKDTMSYKSDQLAPFNLTLVFADEFGNQSYRRLTGVDLITDGTVYSSNDMMSEQSLTYVASDYTPLIPINKKVMVDPLLTGNFPVGENSVKSVIQQRQNNTSLQQGSPGVLYA